MSDFEKALANEISRLKDQLARLMGMSAKPAMRGRKLGRRTKTRTAAKSARKAKGRKPVSAARRKQMREHGAYLGAIRPLSKANRAAVKATRQKSGIPAAIAHAKKLSAGQ